LADGGVLPRKTVTGGSIALGVEAPRGVVGLPIQARAKTLPFAAEMEGFGQGRPKNILQVWARVAHTRGLWAGADFDDMYEVKPRIDELLGSPPDLFTGELEVVPAQSWDVDGAVCFEQQDPLPMTLLAVVLKVGVGG
jgi:hypothetical protein